MIVKRDWDGWPRILTLSDFNLPCSVPERPQPDEILWDQLRQGETSARKRAVMAW